MPRPHSSLAESKASCRLIAMALSVLACVGLRVAMAAPDASEQAHALSIAGYQAFALRDGTFDRPNDGKGFVLGVPPAVPSRELQSHGLATDHFEFSVQPLLVKAGTRVLLFDTGAGPNMGPGAGHLMAALERTGLHPEQVTDIFISHGHGDHVGGLMTPQGALAFPAATVHISKAEWDWLRGMSEQVAARYIVGQHAALIAVVTPKVVTFNPGTVLVPGVVKAVDIRGHSPGHSAYLIGSGTASVLFIGDTMHHFVTSVSHPEWQIAFDGDRRLARQSRIASEGRWVKDAQKLYVGHFPFPGYGTIERRGNENVWRPLD